MPTYLTEFTRRYGPGDDDFDERGVTSAKFAGPYIVAPNLTKAEEIYATLHADPYGDSPLAVLGELDETHAVKSMFDPPDFEQIRKAQQNVMAQMNEIIARKDF